MENYKQKLKLSIGELLGNLILRLEQIAEDLNNNINVSDRIVFFIDDLITLSEGMAAMEVEIDIQEYQFTLNNMVNNLENSEYYLLGDILTLELKPILAEWKGMIENE